MHSADVDLFIEILINKSRYNIREHNSKHKTAKKLSEPGL